MWTALTAGQVVPVRRNIIYLHVPSAICALLCFVVLLVTAVGYLRTTKAAWDYAAAASAQVALVFATVLNVTGSVFSRAEWNTWWTPSPRLISAALLWFLSVVYLILRASIPSPQRRARVCAVFGIIAFLDVPMVIIAARFIPDIHRGGFSFDSAWQAGAFGLVILANFFLAGLLIWIKTDILKNKARLENELVY